MCNYCNICSPRLIEINLIASLKQPSNSVKGSQGQHIEQPKFLQFTRSPTRSITEQNQANNCTLRFWALITSCRNLSLFESVRDTRMSLKARLQVREYIILLSCVHWWSFKHWFCYGRKKDVFSGRGFGKATLKLTNAIPYFSIFWAG